MISLFEPARAGAAFPAGMVSDLIKGGNRGVYALSFLDVDGENAAVGESSKAADGLLDTAAADERAGQVAAMIDAAREDAAERAKREMRVELDSQQGRERARAEHLAVEFARDRRRYFAAAETQVVKLALAVAERILAREVATTELPLAATVRKALERVQDGSETVLRVRPEQVEEWRQMMADEPRILVVEDARMNADDCVLETKIGRIDMGIGAQMQEIERGFEDLMTRSGD